MFKKLNKPKCLMLVDDSQFDLKINRLIALHTKIFDKILLFSSPGAALDHIVDNLQNDENLPQLILLDVQMPEMNGFEFMEKFAKLPKSFREKCHVAMLSSTDDIHDIKRARANINIIRLMRKPLAPSSLTALVNEFFE